MLRIYDVDGVLQEFEPGGSTFHELWADDHQASGTDWEDWDLSSLIPVGTRAVAVGCTNIGSAAIYLGARKNGSTDERKKYVAVKAWFDLIIEVGADRTIEVLAATAADGVFKLTGYWA